MLRITSVLIRVETAAAKMAARRATQILAAAWRATLASLCKFFAALEEVRRPISKGPGYSGRFLFSAVVACLGLLPLFVFGAEPITPRSLLQEILNATRPLPWPRETRLPLYLWGAMDVGTPDEKETEEVLRQLAERGIGAITTWNHKNKETSLTEGLRIARLQKKLGLEVNINATPCLYQFFNGDERTAHVAAGGEPFFDSSFDPNVKMGCPFALDFRIAPIKAQIDFFARAYHEHGLAVNFSFADWEIDGPIEWNGAWWSSQRCQRCRARIKNIDDFTEFQKVIRVIRSDLQRQVFASTMKGYFPKVLVGNYAVYPHNGYREWYDYFEQFVEGSPYQSDQRAKYRQWFQEFPLTGYTFAMPVIYPWRGTFQWYDFKNPDYRWFYNLLWVASNAAANTPRDIPIIPFVHWHTTESSKNPDRAVKQFSEEKYRELLWHMFLRRVDGFFLWCLPEETAQEARLLHAVYTESLEFRKFLDKGEPISFDVPPREGPVVSGLRLGDDVLMRRTDFDDNADPVVVNIQGRTLLVGRMAGKCQRLKLAP